MTVSATDFTPPQYTGNGSTTSFAFSYNFFNGGDLVVTLYDATGTTTTSVFGGTGTYDFTISGTQDPNTGEYLGGANVLLNNAPTSDYLITISRDTAESQNVALTNNGPFPAKTVEGALDRLTLIAQELKAWLADVLQIPQSDPIGLNTVLPAAAVRANQYLAFDSQGNAIAALSAPGTVPIAAAMQPFVQASTLSAALAMLTYSFGGGSARAITAHMGDWWSVKDFGAKGDGATDDTTALNAAETAAAGAGANLWWPAGTYMVNTAGITKKSAVSWSAGQGSATLKAITGTWAVGLVNGTGVSDFSIDGLAFDTTNMTPSGNVGSVQLTNCTAWSVRRCNFNNLQTFGLVVNEGADFIIDGNYFYKATAANTQNEGLLISTASGAVGPGTISNNIFTNTGMDISGTHLVVTGNYVTGWKYGAGITVEENGSCYELLIAFNVLTLGTGTDVNDTIVMGIENWAPRSLILGNVCAWNAGDGIDNGGLQCVVASNVCYNNGQSNNSAAGIVSRYSSGSANGGSSIITANQCFDTQTTKTQGYGYSDQSASLSDISFSANKFSSNKTAPMLAQGARMDWQGPQIYGSTSAFAGGTIANGNSAGGSWAVSGAGPGDMVKCSYSQPTQGLKMFAWCDTAGTVNFRFENSYGSSITLAAGVVQVLCEKPPNYAAY